MDASGRPDESLAVEFISPLEPSDQDGLRSGQLLSILLQKGKLRANVGFQRYHSASLEVLHSNIGSSFESRIKFCLFLSWHILGSLYTRPEVNIKNHSFPSFFFFCLCIMYL